MNSSQLTTHPNTSLLIAPSILSADFSRLGEHVNEAMNAGADIVHIDVMDGHFVPNLTVGPCVVRALRAATDRFFDVHLMLTNPCQYVDSFADAGADHITVHVEADDAPGEAIAQIRDAGCTAGLCLKPGTPADALEPYLPDLGMVLIMTVEPGFGGQSFMADMLSKIERVREMVSEHRLPVHVEVDGGVNAETAARCLAAGANVLVAGSGFFRHPAGMSAAVREFRELAPPTS